LPLSGRTCARTPGASTGHIGHGAARGGLCTESQDRDSSLTPGSRSLGSGFLMETVLLRVKARPRRTPMSRRSAPLSTGCGLLSGCNRPSIAAPGQGRQDLNLRPPGPSWLIQQAYGGMPYANGRVALPRGSGGSIGRCGRYHERYFRPSRLPSALASHDVLREDYPHVPEEAYEAAVLWARENPRHGRPDAP